MTASHEQPQSTPEGNTPGLLRFVEELADENDYWMSLTDAARITRTSEAMARRWVSRGRLPIRKEPVGINQRTRLVRASDVARIRPIVDPTAAITDDIHKLDLLSIPRQQEQIMHDHQRVLELAQRMRQEIEEHFNQNRITLEQGAMELQQQMKEWDRRFALQQGAWQQALDLQQQHHEALVIQVDHQMQEIEHRTDELKEQGKQQQQAQQSLTAQFEKVRATMQEALQEVQQHLKRLDQDFRHQADQMYHDLTARLKQQGERFQDDLGGIEETLAYYDQAHKQMQQDMMDVQQGFLTQRETLMAHIEQQRGEVERVLEQRWSELAHERTAQSERMETIERRLKSMETQDQAKQKTWLAYQERTETQDRQLQTLIMMLHDESAARQSLSEQFILQQEQLQILRRELECLKTQKA